MFRRITALVPLAGLALAAPAFPQNGGVGFGWFDNAAPLLAYAPPQTPLLSGDAADEEQAALGAEDGAHAEIPNSGFGAAFRAEFLTYRARGHASKDDFVSGLRDLIASVEADSRGYDTVQHGARILPDKPPTRMTIAEIRAWIKATPRQQHAIGRYQVIPSTLDMLVERLGIPETAVYTPALQDRMADLLMADAGLHQMLAGEISSEQFLDGLARIWAGLPMASGKSAYHGLAGNKAGMTRASFRDRFAQIMPRR